LKKFEGTLRVQVRGSAGWITLGIHGRTETDQAEINEREVQVPPGTLVIEATRRIGRKFRRSATTRAVAAGGMPHVPGGSGESAEAADACTLVAMEA